MRVFLTSPWIPVEWIRAHGLEPRGIWCDDEFWNTSVPLTAGACAFAEKAVRFAESQTDSAVIFTSSCDQLRRGYDTATFHGQPRAFLFNIPATQSPAAKQIYHCEVERLGLLLLQLGGRAPDFETLRQEMRQASRSRNRLIDSAAGGSPRDFAEAVAQFQWNGGSVAVPPALPEKRVPLAIVGGPMAAPHWPLLDNIEAAGGSIVLNATEIGERSLSPAFALDVADANLLDTLVDGYFDNIIDVFQRPNAALYSWLRPRLASRRVRGILLWHFTGCDLWRAETQTLREAFGLPVLLLEAGERPEVAARDVNRLQAFVESLQ